MKRNLAEWLHYLERLHPTIMDFDLQRIRKVAADLQLTQFNCPVIIVGGTNGKGSCVAFFDAILSAAGYHTATYTSPHLFSYNERIKLNGQMVTDEQLCEAFEIIEHYRGDISLTYFEFGTLAALWIFKQQTQLDVIILEVGLGGRLDAVNIVEPDLSMITTIELDHCEWLGPDREHIGAEKAGIFRANKPAICGDPVIPQSVMNYAATINAQLYVAGRDFNYVQHDKTWTWHSDQFHYDDLPLPMLQLQNAATVLMGLNCLRMQLPVSIAAVRQGLKDANLPGRIQVMQLKGVNYVFDVAHNPQSIAALAFTLANPSLNKKQFAVFSQLRDKDVLNSLVPIMPLIDQWFVAPLPCTRSLSGEELIEKLNISAAQNVQAYPTIAAAFIAAYHTAQAGDEIIIFGSFYTVAEAMLEYRHLLTEDY